MRRCFELLAHMDNVTILSDDDRHYSPVRKNRKVHRRRLEAEGEKFSVMLVGDVSCDVCKNFMRRGLTWVKCGCVLSWLHTRTICWSLMMGDSGQS